MASITRYVEQRLKLKVNDHKSQVVPVSRCKFLGFCFKQNRICWHDKALEKFKREVRRLTGRSWGVSMETKIRNLIKLGVPVKLAISCGMTSKGYWHSARTEGIQRGLTNDWLKRQGLVSLRDRWVALHYG
ncbi:MAG: hypothetical protein H6965_00030 [Chromatiaceae bacterium]|nr:hypothetical protein [Chromatiaceae bacterium]